jgi:Mg/Co/Ni transporter MgtE
LDAKIAPQGVSIAREFTIDGDRHVLGIVNPPTVLGWRHAGKLRDATLAELLAGTPRAPVAYPDEYLDGLVDRMREANVAQMPVVSHEDARLVGYIAWKDLLKVRSKLREAEMRSVILRRAR